VNCWDSDLRVNLLGSVEAIKQGVPISFGGNRIATFLATLVLAEGRPIPDGKISSYLWGFAPPATQSAQLYTYASRLRQMLGKGFPIVRDGGSYQMAASRIDFDVRRFHQFRQQGNRLLTANEPETALEAFDKALSLWRGPAMMGATDHLQAAAGTALDGLRLDIIERRSEALLVLEQHHKLTYELPPLVAENPGRERLRANLMIALYRSDRQNEALDLYENGRRELAAQLGVDPGRYLTSAYMAVLRGGDDRALNRSPERGTDSGRGWPSPGWSPGRDFLGSR
jgi:DNA-binding SARP family transcriptional activator